MLTREIQNNCDDGSYSPDITMWCSLVVRICHCNEQIKKLHRTNTKMTDKGNHEQQQRKETQATRTSTKAINTQLRTTGKRQRILKERDRNEGSTNNRQPNPTNKPQPNVASNNVWTHIAGRE